MVKFMPKCICTQYVPYLLCEFLLLLFCFGAKIEGQISAPISVKNLKSLYEDLGKCFKYLLEEFCFAC